MAAVGAAVKEAAVVAARPVATPTATATAAAGTTGVQGSQAAKVTPEAKLASTALAVSPTGGVVVKVTCPAGATNCAGTVTLRTLSAVSAQAGKKAVLTLASGAFTVGGGSSKSLTLHLSAKARKLLARSHVLRGERRSWRMTRRAPRTQR